MADEVSVSSSSFDRDPIEKLADSFIGRFRAGERPSIEEYVVKYPDLAEEIRELLPALVELELNQSPGGSATGSIAESPIGSGDGAGPSPRQLGDYLILREIGRGGMGVVYEAVQQSLGRHVALKVLPQHILAGSSHLERFRLEARAAARLHHTNIVPVFGVGEQQGVHFYAMQFIQGQGLDEVFEELRRLRGGQSPAAKSVEPSSSRTDRALTLAATHGLLTGRFPAAEGEASPETDADSSVALTQGSATDAGVGEPEPTSARAELSGGSGISTHSELSGTQAETQYYRSVARVGLQVAEGLAYAHSQGIVHRDIKPSNLLLDARGTVWVTDFGLAKSEGTDALTHTGDIIGTLRYMSPERFDGWSDPRSDVYSLGVTLYELLTLQYLFQEPNRAKLIDRVMHDVPPSPRKMDKKVPRDLETIVLKAIAKESGQRYASSEQMAEDLRRFLADKPVLARRSSPAEQAWRWCRRNKALAAASALAIVGLVAAVVVLAISNARIARTSRDLATALYEKDGALKAARESEAKTRLSAAERDRQRKRAEAGEDQARAAVDQFLTRVTDDALLKAPGLQALRRDLLRSALTFYDEFLKQRGDEPGLRAAMADVHRRVGNIQQDLGDATGGRKSFLTARTIYEALAREKPGGLEVQAGLADCQFHLGAYSEAVKLYERLVKRDSQNARYRHELASAYNAQAIGQNDPQKAAEVLEAHRKALALREGLVREFPDDPEARVNLSGTLNNLGVVLSGQGHPQDALSMFLRSVEHNEAAVAKAPQLIQYTRFLGTGYGNVARTLQELGRHDEAIRASQKTIDHWRRMARENPEVPGFRARLYSDSFNFARSLVARNQKTEAAEWFSLAARAMEDMPRKTGGDLYNLACARALAAAAVGEGPGALTDENRQDRVRLIAAAMDALRRSIEMGSENAEKMRTDADLAILRDRADFQLLVTQKQAAENAVALARRGESGTPAERLKAGQEALAARAKLALEDPRSRRHRADMAASQYAIGQVLTDLGRLDEAEKTLNEALAVRASLVKDEPKDVRYQLDLNWTRLALGKVHWKALRLDQADHEWKTGLRAMEAALRDEPDDSPARNELDNAWIEVADRLLQLGLWEGAGELLDRAFRRNPASLAFKDGVFFYFHALLRQRAGDSAGFRAACAEFFRQFKNNENKFNLYRACWLGPNALDDMKVLVPMVNADLARHRDDKWYILHAAMIHARAGHSDRAMEILQANPTDRWDYPENASMLALIYHDLGKIDKSRSTLELARRFQEDQLRTRLEDSGKSPLIDWMDNIVLRDVLRREVSTRLEGMPEKDLPSVLLIRARSLARMGRESEAEKAFAAALGTRPGDPQIVAASARVFAELGRDSGSQEARSRALSLFDRALAARPDDVELLRDRAELRAQRGEWDKVMTDLGRLFASKEAQPRWFVAGAWVVGPYPLDGAKLESELVRPLPPESNPDPARPVVGPDGKAALAWKMAALNAEGFLDLAPLVQPKDRVSTYVLVRVYAPEDRDVIALVANDDWLRFWCNGELILAQPVLLDAVVSVPVRFHTGWNTLLAKVSNQEFGYSLKLKLTTDLEEVAHAFGAYVDRRGWNDEAAARLERIYAMVPDRHGAWDNPDEPLAAQVARRDAVFDRIVASRPKDSLLWAQRGRHLAWLGKWDEALAAYDQMIHDHPDPEDAFVEYAAILLLKGDVTAYRQWCIKLAERFGRSDVPFAGSMLTRACGLTPGALSDPARLVSWAERAVAKAPSKPRFLHDLGMAHLRAGHPENALKPFQASIDAGEDSVRNWYGLALAHGRLDHFTEAGFWSEKAKDWMEAKQSEFADRTTHPTPPIYVTDWLEALILRREAESVVGKRRLGDLVLMDRTASAGEELRLPLGVVELRHDSPRNSPPGSFRLQAPFRTRSPVADGAIGPDEYGPPLAVDFTGDANPGRLYSMKLSKAVTDPKDLSAEVFMAYTNSDLFIAVKVRDNVLIANPGALPYFNDAVELFIDGDRVGGDLNPSEYKGNREGFQVCSGAKGRKYACGVGTSDQDYGARTSTFDGGYIVEFRIPLASIDIDDGAEFASPGPGSTFRFNLGIVDQDEPGDDLQRYGILWSEDRTTSPFLGGEGTWLVDLHLARPVKYKLVEGPTGAAIDAETGVLTWKTPREPQVAKVTVRAVDVEKPELTAEASFTITTRAATGG